MYIFLICHAKSLHYLSKCWKITFMKQHLYLTYRFIENLCLSSPVLFEHILGILRHITKVRRKSRGANIENWLVNVLYWSQTYVAQLVGHRPAKCKVTGSIPSQGTRLGCGFGTLSQRVWVATDRCFSHWCFSPSLPPSL